VRVPLRACVEIALRSGPDAGRRVFRTTDALLLGQDLAVCLELGAALPIEGQGEARVRFALPRGGGGELAWMAQAVDEARAIEADARILFDPERPEDGSRVELLGLTPGELAMIETYIEQRLLT